MLVFLAVILSLSLIMAGIVVFAFKKRLKNLEELSLVHTDIMCEITGGFCGLHENIDTCTKILNNYEDDILSLASSVATLLGEYEDEDEEATQELDLSIDIDFDEPGLEERISVLEGRINELKKRITLVEDLSKDLDNRTKKDIVFGGTFAKR